MTHHRPASALSSTHASCGSHARVMTLHALNRLGGSASFGALLSTTGLDSEALEAALHGLARDRWVRLDSSAPRALGGIWRMSRDRRRLAAANDPS